MIIQGMKLENFMLFDKLDVKFSPNVNIICGENSTGKTALIKLLYACAACFNGTSEDKDGNVRRTPIESDGNNNEIKKIAAVFGLDSVFNVSDLVTMPSNEMLLASVEFEGGKRARIRIQKPYTTDSLQYGFTSVLSNVVYIPPKEMISATENFASLYEEYHISFDETYYDLARLLNRPRKKTLSPKMKKVARGIEELIGGKVRQEGKTFYLDMDGVGKLRMSLVSEGYRKLATLLNLISTGSLSGGSILFWDEPETNMNPRMIEPLVKTILALAGAGVQVFITTHDYFVQQYFGLAAEYCEQYQADAGNLEYRFMSLNKAQAENGAKTVTLESASRLLELEHNAVKDEFDALYDKEVGLIYGDNA